MKIRDIIYSGITFATLGFAFIAPVYRCNLDSHTSVGDYHLNESKTKITKYGSASGIIPSLHPFKEYPPSIFEKICITKWVDTNSDGTFDSKFIRVPPTRIGAPTISVEFTKEDKQLTERIISLDSKI